MLYPIQWKLIPTYLVDTQMDPVQIQISHTQKVLNLKFDLGPSCSVAMQSARPDPVLSNP